MASEDIYRRTALGGGVLVLAGATGALAYRLAPTESLMEEVSGESDGGNDGDPVLTTEPDYEGWFSDVTNYSSGTVVYRRERDEVTVEVGAAGNGDNRAFRFPAIAVSVGTTVIWRWTGEGGAHNVVAVRGTFDSGEPTAAEDTTFEYQFEVPGTFRYFCETHRDSGMKGAVTVYE